MLTFIDTLQHWQQEEFKQVFLGELARLDPHDLPLQQAMALGNMVTDDPPSYMINSKSEVSGHIQVNVGVFFSSIIAGCSCADDPTPVDTQAEYCELRFSIDKSTAETEVSIIR